MSEKLRVGILGATGMVGQRFVSLIEDHPWFKIEVLAASERSAGKTYEEALGGRWSIETPLPDSVKCMVVQNINEIDDICSKVDFVLCAVNMPKDEIRKIEEEYAKHEIPVVSNNSAHRWTPDVPMILPEINPDHIAVIDAQKKRLGTKHGFIAVKPNCSIQSYTPVLEAWKEFEPYEVVVTTYQAISGAGKNFDSWPEMVGNIIPFISGEEEKSEKEPLRIWGKVENGEIVPATTPVITSQCIRVPVLYGHTAAVFVKFKKKPTKEDLIDRMEKFKGEPQDLDLPSAPKQFIKYMEEDNRPQVLMDVNYERGMGVTVGRLRPDSVYDWKFVGLSHNTLRGAAGGAVLCAEDAGFGKLYTDPVPPYGSDGCAYIAQVTTIDGDTCWTEAPYANRGGGVTLNWGRESVELPWNVELADKYSTQFEVRSHMDGSRVGYWLDGSDRESTVSGVLRKTADRDAIDKFRQLGKHAGIAFARASKGVAFACNVDVDMEMASIAKNQLYYNAMARQLSSYISRVKSVMQGGES